MVLARRLANICQKKLTHKTYEKNERIIAHGTIIMAFFFGWFFKIWIYYSVVVCNFPLSMCPNLQNKQWRPPSKHAAATVHDQRSHTNKAKKKNEKLNAIRRKTCRMFFCRWIKWIFLRIIYDLMIPSMALCVFVHRTESRSQNGVSLCFWFWLLCRRRASFFDKLNFVWCFLFAINQPYERWNNKSCCCCIIVDDCQKKNALSIANYCE